MKPETEIKNLKKQIEDLRKLALSAGVPPLVVYLPELVLIKSFERGQKKSVESGYCEEAMEGVRKFTLETMEKYASYRVKEQAKLHLADVKNLLRDSPARQRRINQLEEIINA